jgi:hypothetical protein
MIQYGFIDSVSEVKAGAALTTAALTGETLLSVDDALDFDETGGAVSINGTVYNYTTADPDSDTNTITLTTALIEDLEVGHPIYVAPEATEKRASVILADNGDTLDARVPHGLFDRIPEGIRDNGTQESVTVDLVGSEWVITDIIGKQPVIDGAYLDPATVPAPATDGQPPTASPVPVALGGVGIILVRWQAITNADPVTYSLHMSTTQAFTPDSTTLLNVTPGLSTTVRALPDNTALSYGVDYYFRVVASDADGDADPSSDASAQMFQVNSPDIAANYIYGGQIVADQITGGTISADVTLSSTIKTADSGARVEMSPSGLLITDSTGAPTTQLGTDAENFFKGNIEANGLTVLGGATFRSTTNELSRAAVWTLAAGITNSTNAPTVQVDYEKLQLKDSTGANWPTPGNLRGLSRTPDGYWISADTTGGFHKWNSTGAWVSSTPGVSGLTHVTQPVSGGPYFGAVISGATFSIARLTEDVIFTDDFSGSLANWPNSGTENSGTVGVVSGKAQLSAPTASDYALLSRTLEGSFKTRGVQMKVAQTSGNAGSAGPIMKVESATENTWFDFHIENGLLYAYWVLNGSADWVTVTYDAVQHAYWKIFEFNSRINFQTSPDGVTWTTQKTVVHGRPASVFSGMEWKVEVYGSGNMSNLITNGSFTTNTAGWTPESPATIVRDSLHFTSSPSSGYLSKPIQNTSVRMSYQAIPVVGGRTYAAMAQALGYQTADLQAYFEFNFYDSGGAWLGGGSGGSETDISSASWIDLHGSMVAPAGSATLVFTLGTEFFGTTSFNARTNWDDIVLYDATASVITAQADDAKYSGLVGELPTSRVNTGQSPALGSYTTTGDLLVAEHDSANNRITVRRINHDDMATVVTTFNSGANPGFGGPLAGILRGNFDFPEERYVTNALGAAGTNWWPFKNSDGTYMSGDAFPVITGGNQGISYDGTNFWSLGSDGNLYKHTNIKWTNGTDSASWAVGFTWYDGGSQETTPSPYTTITMKMRARLTVTSSAIPYTAVGDPDRIRVYVGRGGGTKYRQATTAAFVNTATLTTVTFSGTAAPTVNTFASATPAKIRNTDDSLIISADGSVKVKSLTVTDGSPMTMQVFTSSGTWTKPAGCRTVKVRVQGAGGAGGGSDAAASGQNSKGSGGGAGGYAEKVFAASVLAGSITVTVGTGGTGAAGASGNSGGNSSFAHTTAVTGNGGGGGANASTGATPFGAAGGGGGSASGGDINTSGGAGGMAWGDALLGIGGPGGSAHMGGGGAGRASATAPSSLAGFIGGNYGGGGGGALSTSGGAAAAGGNGANGVVIVECYF